MALTMKNFVLCISSVQLRTHKNEDFADPFSLCAATKALDRQGSV